MESVDPKYFYTEGRWGGLQRALEGERVEQENMEGSRVIEEIDRKYGTVGCVALDKSGNLAAGTSTGGMTNKRYNRLGDSPIIGAGTYADNATCGVSCTGWGEYFIRYAVAYDVHARMAYGGATVEEAGKAVIHENPDGQRWHGVVCFDRPWIRMGTSPCHSIRRGCTGGG